MPLQLRRHSKIDILLLLVVAVGGFFAVKYATAIGDTWHSWFYRPSPAIQMLADDAGMNARGKQLFYRFSPQMVGAAMLDSHCGSATLGCAEGRHIYILQSSDTTQQERNIVTAAHEMLHIAYSRLSGGDKQVLQHEIDQLLSSNDGAVARSIREQLQTYSRADYYNEAHSYIGSEMANAGPGLNAYYGRYFADRSKTTNAFLASPEAP